MTTPNPPRPDLAPTSPRNRGDLRDSTSPLAPHPVGGEVDLETPWPTPETTGPPRPRGDVNQPFTTTCEDEWSDGEDFWVICPLPRDHGGLHVSTLEGNHGTTARITWPAAPLPVDGGR